MSYSRALTVGTTVYDATRLYPTSTIRSDLNAGVNADNLLTISHEELSSGKVSSVVIFDNVMKQNSTETCLEDSKIRVLCKLQYDPTDGRLTTAADIDVLVSQLITFLSDPVNVPKLLNLEH